MRKYWLITMVGALTLLVAACQSAPPPVVQVAPAATDLQPPSETPVLTQETREQEPAPETPAPVESVPAAPVEVRGGLSATNPATVDLANGSPKLVEFFAFW